MDEIDFTPASSPSPAREDDNVILTTVGEKITTIPEDKTSTVPDEFKASSYSYASSYSSHWHGPKLKFDDSLSFSLIGCFMVFIGSFAGIIMLCAGACNSLSSPQQRRPLLNPTKIDFPKKIDRDRK